MKSGKRLAVFNLDSSHKPLAGLSSPSRPSSPSSSRARRSSSTRSPFIIPGPLAGSTPPLLVSLLGDRASGSPPCWRACKHRYQTHDHNFLGSSLLKIVFHPD